MKEFNLKSIQGIQDELNNHRVYSLISNRQSLRVFMNRHVFSVWDFMSLVKYLQNSIAPARVPWAPIAGTRSRRFINSIVLEEESDLGPSSGDDEKYASHFELYCKAMKEVGADYESAVQFAGAVLKHGFLPSVELMYIPEASRKFMSKTMGFIATDRPHVVAAAFALGREKIIPEMFRRILAKMNISSEDAPVFHYYLERHIHLDEDFHGPLSLEMLNELCGGDEEKIAEAEKTAYEAIKARIVFWDQVAKDIENPVPLEIVK